MAEAAAVDRTEGNRRLVSMTGVLLHAFLWIEVGSALLFALMAWNVVLPTGPIHPVVRAVHFFVGFFLMPLVGIKIVATMYRFSRYYLRHEHYHAAGAPKPVARLTGPLMIGSISVLFVSGWEMWSFRNDFGIPWIPVHVWAAITFTTVLVIHIVVHVRAAHVHAADELAAVIPAETEPEQWRKEAITRRAVLGGGIGVGLILAVGASQWPGPATAFLAPKRAGSDALDFPVMNYEGGMQRVDVDAWRLVIDSDSGLVGTPLSLTYADILKLPLEDHEFSIDCVTGWTAVRTWRGVSLARLLSMAKTDPEFGHILVRSTSGYHWSHQRANALLAGSLIVTHVNGTVLDDNHGFPVRLMIPGVVGQANVKWIDRITVRAGAPEIYVAPSTAFNNSLPVSGPLLPADPVGQRHP